MNTKYSPPIASEEQYITPPTQIEEEAFLEEMYRYYHPFWKKLLVYVAVWIVIIVACCCVMWNIMKQYEAAQPWYTVEEYITSSGQFAFYTAITKAYGDSVSQYESLYETAIGISGNYLGKLSYKKLVREYTYENPVYLIHSENKNLMKLTLQRGAPTGFMGFTGYSVYNVELIAPDLLNFENYALIYPAGSVIYVNGKEYEPEETEQYAVFGSDEYEVYVISNMLTRPTVKLKYTKDDEDFVSPLEGHHFIFDYPHPKLRTVTATVPEGATVYIDGQKVPEGFISEETKSEPDRFGNTVPMVKYTVPTVAGEGEITASAEDKYLTAVTGGEGTVFSANTLSCSVLVPNGATLYANGEEISSTESTKTAVWRSDFEGVANAPMANEYTFSGIHAVPQFTATIDGAELKMVKDDDKFIFLMPESEELKEAYTKQAVEFMNAYLYYTTQGYSNTRANLNAVKAHVAAPSPLYTNLERSYIGYYYIAPQQMTVDYMEVDNFVPYGENAFTCELSYKLSLKNWVGDAVDENTMRISFAKRDGAFLPVNMRLANE